MSTYLLPSDSDDDPAANRPDYVSYLSTDVTATLQVHTRKSFTSRLPENCCGPDVREIRITDRGSRPQYADVQVQGVPARGVIDSGSDITIMGGELFRHVAMVARLKKSQFHRADKSLKTYDGTPFVLDGMLDLDISFNGVTMKTPIYVKAETTE